MAKEDILLREEMGRLEIEHVKQNKIKSNVNPFASNSKKLLKRVPIQNSSCSCTSVKKNNNGICKRKHNKILKEPVLQVLKTCVAHKVAKSEECPLEISSPQNVNIDTLCTLVKNCNQLKISSESNEELAVKKTNDKKNWWKSDIVCLRDSKEPRPNNPTGSCSQQALNPPCDVTIDELASYFETLVHIPKKMSSMAEMMYI